MRKIERRKNRERMEKKKNAINTDCVLTQLVVAMQLSERDGHKGCENEHTLHGCRGDGWWSHKMAA